jgi:hypothetical protein
MSVGKLADFQIFEEGRTMNEPAVKGFAMRPAIDRIQTLCADGAIKELDRAPQLTPGDLDILETMPMPTLWYPIDIQDRMLRLIRDIEGAGDDRYLHEFGRQSASSVLAFKSMSVITTGARALGERAGRMLIRMAGLGFNFGHWTFVGDSLHDFKVIVTEADGLPDTIRYNLQGFIEHLVESVTQLDIVCTSSRLVRNQVEFYGAPR